MCLSLAALLHRFWYCSLILLSDLVDGVDGVGGVELDAFSDGLDGSGYPNEELAELYDSNETYLSVMTWSVQLVSVSCDVGGGMNILLFLVMLVLLLVVDEWREWKGDLSFNFFNKFSNFGVGNGELLIVGKVVFIVGRVIVI